jgi:hypothetical protein
MYVRAVARVTRDGDDVLAFAFSTALSDYQDEYRARQEAADHPYSSLSGASRTYLVEERVEWLTPLGSPKLHTERKLTTFDAYFDHRR